MLGLMLLCLCLALMVLLAVTLVSFAQLAALESRMLLAPASAQASLHLPMSHYGCHVRPLRWVCCRPLLLGKAPTGNKVVRQGPGGLLLMLSHHARAALYLAVAASTVLLSSMTTQWVALLCSRPKVGAVPGLVCRRPLCVCIRPCDVSFMIKQLVVSYRSG